MAIRHRAAASLSLFLLTCPIAAFAEAGPDPRPDMAGICRAAADEGRVICADIGALDQTLVYNRFGSFNPFGMIFALDRDLAVLREDLSEAAKGQAAATKPLPAAEIRTAADCAALTGSEHGHPDTKLAAGNVRLKDCKRPRPLVLRANVGDVLIVRVSNWLFEPEAPDFSKNFCKAALTQDSNAEAVRPHVSRGDKGALRHHEVACLAADDAETEAGDHEQTIFPEPTDWPRTRGVNFVVQGLTPLPIDGAIHPACIGTGSASPDESFLCKYKLHQEGTYFFASQAAPAGGEGNGGSIVHGLFGALMVERAGTRAYRSQTSAAAFDAVWPRAESSVRHARSDILDYERVLDNDDAALRAPILNMAMVLDEPAPGAPPDQRAFADATRLEIVHSDLNAIIYCDPSIAGNDCRAEAVDRPALSREPGFNAFREFSVFFHDELKTFYTRNFEELEQFGQLAGVKDGFAINYGASGMGSLLLANRKGMGPASECAECMYEEFFLASWANGDPALLEWYADDPSNVHHSYLNDPVVFRNFHAGPKETHVFHLHAHQWFAGNDPSRGSYLDSQTVAPQQGFTYNIYHGGLRGLDGPERGWWDTQGSGNRNRTIGDSIFHCHLYPHFAQGMWALWRVHDVLEDGTRKLPDGQPNAALSTRFPTAEERGHSRPGSVDRLTGAWIGPKAGDPDETVGTPVPALIPLPGEPLPLLPTYATADDVDDTGDTPILRADAKTPMPGFPFYIAGQPGHRPPQAPLDIARDLGEIADGSITNAGTDGILAKVDDRAIGEGWLDGGIGRHVVADGSRRELGFGLPERISDLLEPAAFDALTEEERSALTNQIVAKAFALGDLSAHLTEARIETLPNDGTRLERGAMGFHFDGRLYRAEGLNPGLRLTDAAGTDLADAPVNGLYPTAHAPLPDGSPAPNPKNSWPVNGNPPKPGAPFADPCGATAPETRAAVTPGVDPFMRTADGDTDYFHDPFLLGFRRYEVSAVQLDMIVNRAGWHDPQARINVLTAESDRFKEAAGVAPKPISPTISDTEEPFFFRALSGECIEFRHTNELPKDLQLDDFQVKTPTDTVGQHIHLVKFDVTSSDGSGNGWNYEDGTFAADELAARRCASAGNVTPREDAAGITLDAGECEGPDPALHDIWRLSRSENRNRFQTTVQRWFADPILTMNGDPDDPQLRDRTLRTVFTHDHFGPSSIQQHGFYSALVIEPGVGVPPGPVQLPDASGDVGAEAELASICTPDGASCVGPVPAADRLSAVAWGGEVWDGTKRRVRMQGDNPTHPDYREFALSIADFALLYDPRDRTSAAELKATAGLGPDGIAGPEDPPFADPFGMGQIYCEAKWRLSPYILNRKCGVAATKEFAADFDDLDSDSWFLSGDLAPAWIAGGTNRDDAHKARFRGDIFAEPTPTAAEVETLFDHLVSYRQRAAGILTPPADPATATLARPVAPPRRPESISVDHHDPYLVNYRGAPIPLRVGDKVAGAAPSSDCRLRAMGVAGDHAAESSEVAATLADGAFGECSVDTQMTGAQGDMGGALRSALHGDPETPILEAYQDERLVIRLIQGAQEVQHTFNVAGLAFRRNIDQAFPAGKQPLGLSDERRATPSLRDDCLGNAAPLGPPVPAALDGRPDTYRAWRDTAEEHGAHSQFWQDYEKVIAGCDNVEGITFAQEIGISEHFEMNGSLRADIPVSIETAGGFLAEAPSDDVPERSSDYLYNFGSVDALWNGAWGLMRIYRDPSAPDPATVAVFNTGNADAPELTAAGRPIGERLGESGSRSESVDGQSMPVGTGGLACPYPGEGEPPQRVIDAVLAAVETRTVWPAAKGTDYGAGRYDPDGLMLALLSPADLGIAGGIGSAEGWDGVTRRTVADAVAFRYRHGPRPMTLRVRAGDCVRLRYVNALTDSDGGLSDRLGDATMPPIVPLNADPFPHAPEHGGSKGGLQPVGPDMRPGGVRPSDQVALSVGLPGMDLIRDLPLAYGYGAPGLAAASGEGVSVSRPYLFYAGRMRLDLPGEAGLLDLRAEIAARVAQHLADLAPAWLSEGTDSFPTAGETDFLVPVELQSDGDAVFSVLGQSYGFMLSPAAPSGPLSQRLWDAEPLIDGSPDGLDELVAAVCDGAECLDRDAVRAQLMEAARRAALEELDARVHWIPYAFGPVPIRSTSDVVSHVQHGLFGAIDVVPRTWNPVGVMGQQMACEVVDRYEICAAHHAEGADPGPGDGGTMLFDAQGPDGRVERTREFVLYYQDGLNLWDDGSRISWEWEDSGNAVTEDDGTPVSMVPDCIVCDDSYDRGEKGVNYRSPSFSQVLSEPAVRIEESDDLNAFVFPPDYLAAHPNALRLKACEGEQIVVRVVHPGGRARQRAFVMNGYNYDDLFPGFGFPRSVLLAPGKGMTAWLTPKAVPGTAIWHDGPTHIRAGGVWGLLEVAEAEKCGD
ncbi:hypothetical protein JHW45_06190 [Paracoccus stylophorae]|uniref:Multicopper oxidase n=1 Tax=Paracoccus stylophorae TaxID=659350 RepID=A0ABY7SYN4_9RHOB|nr:hypothetical protein [Paracoccus stylophorae]WCR11944.1 hypothetical protein JHW45_06190 [Paracoccus stylophorae]